MSNYSTEYFKWMDETDAKGLKEEPTEEEMILSMREVMRDLANYKEITEFTKRQREVFDFVFIEGFSERKAAVLLGTTQQNVHEHVDKTRLILRRLIFAKLHEERNRK